MTRTWMWVWIAASWVVLAAPVLRAESRQGGTTAKLAAGPESDWRAMDYGFNYVPTRTLVEHFAPFWIQSRVTLEQMKRDLLTMRALNARFVRFCLYPANAKRDSLPGADPEKSVEVMDQAMKFARQIGLSVHVDIFSHPPLITNEEVQAIVRRLKGVAESYQIGNEPYFLWGESDENYRHVFGLIAAGKQIDPQAKFSFDVFAPDLERLHQRFPQWYEMLDMQLIHFYATSDHRGWQPVYVEQLVNYLGGTDNRFEQLKDERFVQSEFYPGRYMSNDKPKWVTEITASGYYRWSNLTPEAVKVANWRTVCEALAKRTTVTRVAHHCFRDKMSCIEWGCGECGVVWVDDSPKPLAQAFKEMAAKSLPPDDLARWVKVEVNVRDAEVEVLLDNRLDRELAGTLEITATTDLSVPPGPTAMVLPARGKASHRAVLKIAAAAAAGRLATSHVFARFSEMNPANEHRTVVGWGLLKRSREVTVDAAPTPFDGVRYVGGIEAVQEFFRKYPEPVIVFGDAMGFDSELAYRLKSMLQGVTGRTFDLACAADARPLLDRPVIIIGNPDVNLYAKLVESAAPPTCRASAANKSLLAIIPKPFAYRDRFSRISSAIGYAYSPACLYIAGVDNDNVRRAVYDLIRRIWVYIPTDIREKVRGEHPITGSAARRFRIDLSPGPYTLNLTLGEWSGRQCITTVNLDGGMVHGPFTTVDQPTTFPLRVEVVRDHLQMTFTSKPDRVWAIAELEVAHAGLLADYRHFVFSGSPEVEKTAGNEKLITPKTSYSRETGYGWLD